ncbi:hypothetical protein ACIA5C_38050 [Actinoplanes sp. NPDC051343]|uniref:hypothetical protein n=1 Tax=Actinoplanes sp. NPDC051343 TaxID=3363906 RepID=UPI0037BC82E0
MEANARKHTVQLADGLTAREMKGEQHGRSRQYSRTYERAPGLAVSIYGRRRWSTWTPFINSQISAMK